MDCSMHLVALCHPILWRRNVRVITSWGKLRCNLHASPWVMWGVARADARATVQYVNVQLWRAGVLETKRVQQQQRVLDHRIWSQDRPNLSDDCPVPTTALPASLTTHFSTLPQRLTAPSTLQLLYSAYVNNVSNRFVWFKLYNVSAGTNSYRFKWKYPEIANIPTSTYSAYL